MTCFKRPALRPALLVALLLQGGLFAGCTTLSAEQQVAGQTTMSSEQKAYEAQVAEIVKQDPLFSLLTAEIASQRGDIYSATLAYTEAARQMRNPELAKRAVEISLAEGQLDLALKAAQVWASLDPSDKQAARSIMLLQLGTNRVDEAMPALRTYVQDMKNAESAHPGITGASAERAALEMLLRIPDKARAYQTGLDLFGNNPDDIEAQTMLAQLASASDLHPQAVGHMEQVLRKSPQERHYVLMAQLLEKRDGNPDAAMKLVDEQARQHPGWFGARLYLARNHTQLGQWEQARQRFAEMIKLQPDNIPLYSSQGFVLTQLKDYKAAEQHFRTYLDKTAPADRQNEILIHVTLSDMAVERKDFAGALKWLDSTPNAADVLDVQLKKSALYDKQGNPQQAKRVLDQFKTKNEDESVRLTLAKSQLAESRKAPAEAITELEQALVRHPDQPDLLYERAMVAERQDDLPRVEQYLKRLIAVKPDNPHGYNALGYTWAENNIHLDQALELIKKAVELAPNDPFILDSLGWVHYRLGQFSMAEATLKKAFELRQDEEIGLHLLEVLVNSGKKEEARQ
ncbi:MAG TPA: tetratricopeptide repeat protein, partial [Limnobacter sp.]|nr:tetratricopeptide repeat protein [Limnobacter sp.]